ncbi:hypothetical protein UlMin_031563 [Ulmus minor]
MKFKKGSLVEVLRTEKNLYGSWFSATILAIDGDGYIVSYKLLKDPLGEVVVERVNKEKIRPQPPNQKGKRWKVGDVAEVQNNTQKPAVLGRSFEMDGHDHAFGPELACKDATLGRSFKKTRLSPEADESNRPLIRYHLVFRRFGSSNSPLVEVNNQTKPDEEINSSQHRSSEDSYQCSVASCSLNDIADCMRGSSRNSSLSSGAESAFPSLSSKKNTLPFHGHKLEGDIHKLELQAYKSTVEALFVSGPLSWEQESLLTNLRLSLHISNEEHLVQLRQLLSAQIL